MAFTVPVVIAGYARSPFTAAGKGALSKVRADDLAAQVIKGLMKQTGVKPELVEDLILGCAFPEGEQGFNLARLVGFIAGLPQSVAGVTVNRFCGSSMQAVHIAAGAIQLGAGECFIAAGVESMSRVPMTGFNPMPNPELYARMPEAYMGMGETAENLAKKYSIPRADQEVFAVASHKKATSAQGKGYFKNEIIPIETPNGVVKEDGLIRPEANVAKLAELKPAFDAKGSVTAGTSSPLTDGASAVLVCSEAFAKKHKLKVMARILGTAVSGCAPEIMGIGPVESSRKALERAGLTLADMDIIELNEAFAAQSLSVLKELKVDESKVNMDGGATALGHPLGASGARILGKAASLLVRTGKTYALATMCIGGGQGIATVLEKA
ncbi:MAG TPA: thiolase family protein [Alphaproteobacteria bacterium]|nr:thiolase family protein [Alphaproteobacteria bacterium]